MAKRPGGKGRERAVEGGRDTGAAAEPTALFRPLPPFTAHAASPKTATPGTILARMTVRTPAPRRRDRGPAAGRTPAPAIAPASRRRSARRAAEYASLSRAGPRPGARSPAR